MICPCYQDAKNLRSYAICHWIFASIDFEWQLKNDMLKCWRLNAVSFIFSFNWTWIKSCVSCNITEFIDCDEIKWYVLMYLDHAISIFCILEFSIYFISKIFYESKDSLLAILRIYTNIHNEFKTLMKYHSMKEKICQKVRGIDFRHLHLKS